MHSLRVFKSDAAELGVKRVSTTITSTIYSFRSTVIVSSGGAFHLSLPTKDHSCSHVRHPSSAMTHNILVMVVKVDNDGFVIKNNKPSFNQNDMINVYIFWPQRK